MLTQGRSPYCPPLQEMEFQLFLLATAMAVVMQVGMAVVITFITEAEVIVVTIEEAFFIAIQCMPVVPASGLGTDTNATTVGTETDDY
ncbi:MAG: hypothetical protein ACLPVO_20000 [Desulfomonilaceae bacterium]